MSQENKIPGCLVDKASFSPEKWKKYGENIVKVIIGIFAALLIVSWIIVLDISVKGHRELAIAADHNASCDYAYLEGDAPRARLFKFLSPRIKLLNVVMQTVLTVYTGSLILCSIIVWHVARSSYLCRGDNVTNGFVCGIYVLASLGLITWLTAAAGMSSANDEENKAGRFFFPLQQNELEKYAEKIDSQNMGRMSVHMWTNFIVLAYFATVYQISNGNTLVKMVFSLWATSAVLLAAGSYYSPRLFNSAVYDYKTLKDKFDTAYDQLSADEKRVVCNAMRRNRLLKDGKHMTSADCETEDALRLMFDYTEHQKGKEFSSATEAEIGVSAQMQKLRDVLSEARKLKAGESLMAKISGAVMIFSVFGFMAVLYPLITRLLTMDNVVYDYSGTTIALSVIALLLVALVSFAWIQSSIVSTDSDIAHKKEN